MDSISSKRIIVAMTGASGVIYGIELLKVLSKIDIETHLILSEAAKRNILIETDFSIKDVESLASVLYDYKDIGSSIASGSFITNGMVIAPCTIKTLSAIANSFNDNLIVRAADVCLKERRKLILMVRETPLHLGHLRLMSSVSELGGIILPPIPAFYHRPKDIKDIIAQSIGKVLDLFGLNHNLFERWTGHK